MPQMMEECLRYYVLEYHIDGFILNPVLAPMEAILADPLLKRTKNLAKQRRFSDYDETFPERRRRDGTRSDVVAETAVKGTKKL